MNECYWVKHKKEKDLENAIIEWFTLPKIGDSLNERFIKSIEFNNKEINGQCKSERLTKTYECKIGFTDDNKIMYSKCTCTHGKFKGNKSKCKHCCTLGSFAIEMVNGEKENN